MKTLPNLWLLCFSDGSTQTLKPDQVNMALDWYFQLDCYQYTPAKKERGLGFIYRYRGKSVWIVFCERLVPL